MVLNHHQFLLLLTQVQPLLYTTHMFAPSLVKDFKFFHRRFFINDIANFFKNIFSSSHALNTINIKKFFKQFIVFIYSSIEMNIRHIRWLIHPKPKKTSVYFCQTVEIISFPCCLIPSEPQCLLINWRFSSPIAIRHSLIISPSMNGFPISRATQKLADTNRSHLFSIGFRKQR